MVAELAPKSFGNFISLVSNYKKSIIKELNNVALSNLAKEAGRIKDVDALAALAKDAGRIEDVDALAAALAKEAGKIEDVDALVTLLNALKDKDVKVIGLHKNERGVW